MGGVKWGPPSCTYPFLGGYNSAPSCTVLVFDPPYIQGWEIFFESTLEYEFHMSRKRISFQIFDRLWEFPPTEFLKRGIFAHFLVFFGGPRGGPRGGPGVPKVFLAKINISKIKKKNCKKNSKFFFHPPGGSKFGAEWDPRREDPPRYTFYSKPSIN